jgi:hypothetical protein
VNARIALAIAAIALLGMGMYLFVEVRSAPADAKSTAPSPAPSPAQPASSDVTDPVPSWDSPHDHGKPAPPPADLGGVRHVDPPAPPEIADTPPEDQKANPKLDAIMDQANKAYDRQDFDDARTIAGKVLAKQPNNIRMLRIMVSSLPKFDRDQMKARCDRYGVSFTDTP